MLKTLESLKLKPGEGVQLTAEELALLVEDLRELEKFREKRRLKDSIGPI